MQKNTRIEGAGKYEVKIDIDTGDKLSAGEEWLWDEKRQDWVVNRNLTQNVKLPSDEVDRIDKVLKDEKDNCFKL